MGDEPQPEGHPIIVALSGGFLGGLVAGGNNAGLLGLFVLSLRASFGLLCALGHVRRETWADSLATLIGLSTMIPLPAGFVGLLVGKALWG